MFWLELNTDIFFEYMINHGKENKAMDFFFEHQLKCFIRFVQPIDIRLSELGGSI